jgi:hypothetical protein
MVIHQLRVQATAISVQTHQHSKAATSTSSCGISGDLVEGLEVSAAAEAAAAAAACGLI